METISPPSDPLTLAQHVLACDEGTATDHERRTVVTFCQEHTSDTWPCPEAENLAATLREREEQATRRYREREEYFARLFKVADAGQYRADWDAAVQRWMNEQQAIGGKRALREFAAHVRETAATEEEAGYATDADDRADTIPMTPQDGDLE